VTCRFALASPTDRSFADRFIDAEFARRPGHDQTRGPGQRACSQLTSALPCCASFPGAGTVAPAARATMTTSSG